MSCSGGKCMRKGPITSNGYLNFLREYRSKCCGMSPVQTVRCGAKAWNRLTCKQKRKYQMMACKRPKRRKRKKRSGCRKSRPRKRRCGAKRRRKPRGCGCKKKRRRPKRSSCGKRKRRKHCMKPGPVTNNGYLNFLRWYRKKRCGLKPNDAIRLGARRWCALPQHKKDRFRRMACKVTTSKRRKRSRLCRRC